MPDTAVIRLPSGWYRGLLPRLRHKEPLHVDVFHPQQFFLFVDAARIAGQAAVRSDDPVARDKDRDPIVPDGTAHCLRALADGGYKVSRIYACGGMAQSDLWMQIHADVTGVEICTRQLRDAACRSTQNRPLREL